MQLLVVMPAQIQAKSGDAKEGTQPVAAGVH